MRGEAVDGSASLDADVGGGTVRPVLAWIAVVLVVAAGVLLVVADGTPQAEVEHLWSTDGAATYTAWPGYGEIDAPYPEEHGDIAPPDAPAARRLALVAAAAGIAAIVVASTRFLGRLFGVLVAVGVVSMAAASYLGVGSSLAYGSIGHAQSCRYPVDCPVGSNGLDVGLIEQWEWKTPQLAIQIIAAGVLLVAAGVTSAAHRPTPELQPTLSDRDVARLLR